MKHCDQLINNVYRQTKYYFELPGILYYFVYRIS